ncbi:hypothetical protein [Providencia heimbachae]|uniref:hypothetical protein n=1 Tax=Providencia heimbachae TaxID=333962 RepID=UPI0008389BE0|nr:hypothetical protein [Providencia heimbachae]NIH20920.1 hypothetical protein [Providencia heimbachae]
MLGSIASPLNRPSVSSINNMGNSHEINGMASQISSVGSPKIESQFPVNSSKIKNTIEIGGNSRDLHNKNNQMQANEVSQLLQAVDSSITHEMVLSVLLAGSTGHLTQQKLNYEPETSLIILTLLKPEETTPDLLKSSAKMIKDINSTLAIHDFSTEQKVTKKSLIEFDKQIDKSLSLLGKDKLNVISERFSDKYVYPEIKEMLGRYLTDETINDLPIDKFLITSENQKKNNAISEMVKLYEKHGSKNYVDKDCQLNNIFCALEEKVEIISSLKVTVNGKEPQSLPEDSAASLQPTDEVDNGTGAAYQVREPASSVPSKSTNITNNYGNTYIYNYPSSSFKENLSNVTHSDLTESESNQPLAPLNEQIFTQKPVKLQQQAPKLLPEEPRVDYDDEVDAPIPKKPATVFNTLFNPPISVSRAKQSINEPPLIKETLMSASDLSKQEKINHFLPKNFIVDKYTSQGGKWALSDSTGQKAVTLSANGASTRNQSEKDKYYESSEVNQTSAINDMFASPFEKADDAETTGNKWQLDDTKTSKPVTLTELGAVTRDQSRKEAYTTGFLKD